MSLTAAPAPGWMSRGADLPGPGASEDALRRFLHALPGVDRVGAEARVATLATRSIKDASKDQALDLLVRMIDLTTLEGADTPGKVRSLARKGLRPDPQDPTCPPVAAICIYPDLVADVVDVVRGSGVHVAAVATAFPSGRGPLAAKLADTRQAIEEGADEIDMVIDRGAFLAGRYAQVLDEIAAVQQVCAAGGAHLKVILETGELATLDNARRASVLAMLGGADFIKTSTGKEGVNATLPVSLVMLRMIRDYEEKSGGVRIGYKPAGGISTAKNVLEYQVLMKEELGRPWLEPDLFRVGASSLLADIERQLEHHVTGRYSAFNRHGVA
jgi:deoxyribose-phosphate aldolase